MMDPDYMPLFHRDPQTIYSVLLHDGWHPVSDGDSARFLFVGWNDFDNEEDDCYETGLALEFTSEKWERTVLVPIAHVLAYSTDNRMRMREINERNS